MNKLFKLNFVSCSILLALGHAAYAEEVTVDTVPVLPETEAGQMVDESGVAITQAEIAVTPVNNTDLSQLLKQQPGVGIDDGTSSVRGGDIAPEEISLSDARPHQTQYMIGGVGTNNISTYGQSSGFSSLSSGHTSGYFVDTNLMGEVEVMDHNIGAQYGGFTGGVINVELRQPTDEFIAEYQYRMTDSHWNSSAKVDEKNKGYETANYGDGRYQPEYQKRFHSLHLSGAINDNNKLAINVSKKTSDIPLQQNGVKKDFGQTIDNLFVTHIYQNNLWSLTSDFRYSNFEDHSFLNDPLQENASQPNSEAVNSHSSLGGTFKLLGQFDAGRWTTTLAYDHMDDERSSTADYHRTDIVMVGGMQRANSGGYGNLVQSQDSWQLKSLFDFESMYWQETRHDLQVGGEYLFQQGTGKRSSNFSAFSYMKRPTSEKIAIWNEYDRGEYQADVTTTALFITDNIRWQQLGLSLGLRASHSDVFDETVFAPRTTASWDFSNQRMNRITLGAARYYSGSLLGWALQNEAKSLHTTYQNCTSATGDYSSNNLRDYQCKTSKPQVPIDLNQADTPYSDELTLAWSVDVGNINITPSYVYRQQRKGLSLSDDRVENNIESDSGIYGLLIENIDAWSIAGGELSTLLEVSYTDRKGAGSTSAVYDAVNDLDQGYESQWVMIDGELVRSDQMDTSSYNSPWKAHLATVMNWRQIGLSWSNMVNYDSGRKLTQYKGYTVADIDGEPERIKELISKDMDSLVTWDTSVRWQLEPLIQHDAMFELSVTNVLNKQVEVSTYGTSMSPTSYFGKGREIWLNFSIRN
ncbi:hypothetical protein [Photobacterium nomapromontoriensis]|uniref:hypothetical protein n=1 Tax=Photobacterium nomapromontoriensis TaxID=2910237 RepID=UPI003D098A54